MKLGLIRVPLVVRITLIIGALVLSCFAFSGIVCMRRARRLREDVCQLQLDKTTFSDVARISANYGGFVVSHDNSPGSCSPEGCTYVISVENAFMKPVPVVPRIVYFARLSISDNKLTERYLGIGRISGNHSQEVFIDQSSYSKISESYRIISESKPTRNGISIRPDASAKFVQLAYSLRLGCLAQVVGCGRMEKLFAILVDQAGRA